MSRARKHNLRQLKQAQKQLSKFKILESKLGLLENLFTDILKGTPGLTQQLEVAMKQLDRLNEKGGA